MQLLSWLFCQLLIPILSHAVVVSVSGQCQPDQQALLLQLKNSLLYKARYSAKLVTWNNSSDCCSWQGVNCTYGQVTSLDLSSEWITDGINGSSNLFRLQYLQRLNLAFNRLNSAAIPPELGKLTNLSYLNLSHTGFAGQIPGAISSLRRLVILDLSSYPWTEPLVLESPNLRMFVQNFTELTELYLDGVRISAQGKEWCQALSSSLPNLRVLSLSDSNISGPIDISLLKLSGLSEIRLDHNNLSTTIPEFFGNFSNLTSLSLAYSSLFGEIPWVIFQLPMLQHVDLSSNELLQGPLLKFPLNASLRTLILSQTNVSGRIPDSIGNLKMLSRLDHSYCSLIGEISSLIAGLKELVDLDLSYNNLTGGIPSFSESTNLEQLILGGNNLAGQLESTKWESLQRLENLDLGYNQLNGTVPSSLFSLPSLRSIQLSNNQLSGKLDFSKFSSSPLETLDLSSNQLGGIIRMSVFELQGLKFLSLSYNNLSGHFNLSLAQQLKTLSSVDLSYNRLSVNAEGVPESSFPLFSTLKLASCKLMAIPEFLRGQSRLSYLDLSNNQINGQIPNWLWRSGNLQYLNLSHNHLVTIEEPQQAPLMLNVIDVHNNLLQGQIPHIPFATYLDFSDNNLSSKIPDHIGDALTQAYYFSVSGNKLNGSIPASICDAPYLHVLDLSNNFLSGNIPPCLTYMSERLGVLNLRRNKLGGTIPDVFPKNCSLQTLRLSGNSLQGKVPSSLANCGHLEVLDLGNNRIDGGFPCHLKSIASLCVLVLRANHFSGTIGCQQANDTWPMLQILDIASNKFRGRLPGNTIRTWQAMKLHEDKSVSSEVRQLEFEVLQLSKLYYEDAITITSKGAERELVKILTIFTSIDLSCNSFTGPIPEAIGELNGLYLLNLSHNTLAGSIPSSLGNASQLESLDLSCNELKGEIPARLADLNFLSFLNLSNNKLEGMIPTSTQLQSFSEASFEPNKALCGLPLNRTCSETSKQGTTEDGDSESVNGFEWSLLSIEIGFIVGLKILLVPLYFCKEWRIWYSKLVDHVAFRLCPRLEQRTLTHST